MAQLAVPLILIVYLWVCMGDNSCVGPHRFHCKNVTTAEACGLRDVCLSYWKNARWSRFQNDLSAQCTYCLHIVNFLNDTSYVNRLCDIARIPPDSCGDFMDTWKINNINKDKDIVFCNVVGLCRSHAYLGDLNFGSAVCEDCKKIVDDVRALLIDNATATAITQKVDSVICQRIPAPFRNICTETVISHVPALLHLIEVELEPQDICALFALCQKADQIGVSLSDLIPEETESPKVVSTHTNCEKSQAFSWINRPSPNKHPMWTSRDKLTSEMHPESTEKPSCEQCKEVFDQVRNALTDPVMQEKIKRDIDGKLCSTLPSFLQQACSTAINVHFDEIISGLNETSTAEICITFGMCVYPKCPRLSSFNNAVQQTPLQPGVPMPGTCELCEIVGHKLLDLVLGNVTEESIRKALDTVCDYLPLRFKAECRAFVDQYGAQIIDAIIKGTAPKLFCVTIGLCGPFPGAEVQNVPPQPERLSYCDTCKLFVTVIQQQIEQNQTKEGLENAVKKLCDVLPESYKQECKALVDVYLPAVLDYVAKSMTPEEICQEIGLCKTKDRVLDDILPCRLLDMNVLCSSLEVAAKCGKKDACLSYHRERYLQDSLQSSQDASDCSVCATVLNRWKTFKHLFGQVLENGHSCVGYTEPNDRALCRLVVDNRFKIQQKLMDSTISIVELCKQFNLCPSNSRRIPVTGGLDKSDEALILACSIDPKILCGSQRLTWLCGINHLCQALDPNKNKLNLPVDIFGGNPCLWGPSYYCQNEERAQRCGPNAVAYCHSKIWNTQTAPRLGENPCTWGPRYWCASEENAASCGPGAVNHCLRKASKSSSEV